MICKTSTHADYHVREGRILSTGAEGKPRQIHSSQNRSPVVVIVT